MEHIKYIPSHTIPDEILGSTKVPGRQSAAPSDVRWRPGRPRPASGWGFKHHKAKVGYGCGLF